MGAAYCLPFALQDPAVFTPIGNAPPTFSNSGLRSGGGNVKMITGGANLSSFVALAHPGGTRVVVDTFYWRRTTTTSANTPIYTATNASGNGTLRLNATTHTITPFAGANVGTASAAMTLNQWYRFDVLYVVSGGVYSMSWWIDGVAQTGTSTSQADADITFTRLGNTSAVTVTCEYMDHAGSYTSGDAPLGEYKQNAYDLATVVGANHSLGTFQKTGAVAITSGDSTSHTELTEKPYNVTSYVAQTAIGGTNYLEYPVADSSESVPPAVVYVGTGWAGSAANAYVMEVRAYDGTTEGSDILVGSNAAKTGTTLRVPLAYQMSSPPSGGSWTTTKFNALCFRFGFSTDVTPNPRLGAITVAAVFPVVVTVNGAAALSGAGTLSATGARSTSGAAALTGAGTLAATGKVTVYGSAALVGSGTLAATGARVKQGTAALSGSGTLAATGTRATSGSASLTGTGSLSVTGARVVRGTAALTGAGVLAATGTRTATSSAALSGSGVVSATGTRVVSSSVALAGTGVLAATGARVLPGSATLSAAGTLAASGLVTVTGTAALSGAGTLEADGVVLAVTYGEAHLTCGSVFIATGARVVYGEADLVCGGAGDGEPPIVVTSGGGAILRFDLRPVYASAHLYARGVMEASGSVRRGPDTVDDEEEAIRLAIELL